MAETSIETGKNPPDRYQGIIVGITWAMRIFVGALFLFSGFTKGIDPWGTIFKFKEYFSAWGYEVWDGLNLGGVFTLCLVEFLTGFSLLFGCFRRATPILALLIMVLMLPLTLWLAIANPITDCGCFGDALHLTNWQTFYKNVIISAGAVWLMIYNRKIACLITPYLQWIAITFSGAYILSITWLGYYYQPLIDFREYKIGTPLVMADETQEDSFDEDNLLRFVYEKDGKQQEFSIDDILPDEENGWTFVKRYYLESPEENETVKLPDFNADNTKTLRFYTEDGHQDVTEDIIGHGRQLILMIPDMQTVTAAKTWKINSFYEWCKINNIEMIATMGGNPSEIAVWKDLSLAEYPIYTSDDTSIEEVVRGNPGLVYIEDGIIRWKSSLQSINIDDFQKEDVTNNPMSFARDNGRILRTLSWIYLGAIAMLLVLSLSSKIIFRPKQKSIPHEDNNAC